MNTSTFYPIVLCISISVGFLYYYNSEIHEDYNLVINEVKFVDDQLDQSLRSSFVQFENFSKKKESYMHLYDEHSDFSNDAWFTLSMPELISKEINKINTAKLQKLLYPYYDIAMNSKDSILAFNYMKMALMDRTIYLMDSLNNVQKIGFTTSLITMNEPMIYRVGEVYPLYFATINTIDKFDLNKFELSQNGKQLDMNEFPLIYTNPSKKENFRINSKNGSNNFLNEDLHTRNHKKSQFIKP